MTNTSADCNMRLDWFRVAQWSALIVAVMGLLLLIYVMMWSIPLDVAGELVESSDPENLDAHAAVSKRWLVVGGLTVPIFVYAFFVSRSILTSSRRLFLLHSVWMLLLLCILPLSGVLLQASDSGAPIGCPFWLALLVLLVWLLMICARSLRSNHVPRTAELVPRTADRKLD